MPPVTYKDAGVDIDRGDRVVERITKCAAETHRPGVLSGLGGYGSLFGLKEAGNFKDPVLVTGCDGVGTKLKLAFMAGEHKTVGIDLVAMSVNDILCHGAEPLYFLDYFATGKLDVEQAAGVIEGIATGCKLAGCALVGGETAEMPGFYTPGEYDLAGFAVGIVERAELLPRPSVAPGDVLLGLASSGLHSNGYSLARKLVFDVLGLGIDDELPNGAGPVRSTLLAPTRIYVQSFLHLRNQVPIKALAHITGGGLVENVPRVLPKDTMAVIDPASWPEQRLFKVLTESGEIPASEAFRVFNMGIGMVVVVAKEHAERASEHLAQAGEIVFRIGSVERGSGEATCRVTGAS